MKKLLGKAAKILLGCIGVPGAFFFLIFILTTGDYPVPKTISDDSGIPHVTINGVVFHAQTFGDPKNPVVLVVHGGPGWDYRSLLPLKALADEFYVVFYDQREPVFPLELIQKNSLWNHLLRISTPSLIILPRGKR